MFVLPSSDSSVLQIFENFMLENVWIDKICVCLKLQVTVTLFLLCGLNIALSSVCKKSHCNVYSVLDKLFRVCH